ncbi:MAG: RNA polymerase sigma factor [bacterium]|nr:RNA polymerase sigma factor [bacterium]
MSRSATERILTAHSGDYEAMQALLAEHLPWIEQHVRRKLSKLLRRDGETQDFVQEAVLEVLREGPKFALENRDGFRSLLARIVENNLRDRYRHLFRECRDIRRQRAIPSDSVLVLDDAVRRVTEPPANAERGEREAWMNLAVEMLAPGDREVVRLRVWEGQQFAEIGRTLGLGEDAARKRYGRALPRLARKLEMLREGNWRQSLEE